MFDFAILPLFLFCLIVTGTPGPNNMINLAQGVRVGFCRALPFAVGTGLGLASMLTLAGVGLGAVFISVPWLLWAMKSLTLAFLLYLAFRLVTAGPIGEVGTGKTAGDRIGFLGGVLFQWINPKSWFAILSIATTYLPAEPTLGSALAAGLIFALASQLTQPVWIAFGSVLRRFLADPARARVFNVVMAALLLASTLPVLLGLI